MLRIIFSFVLLFCVGCTCPKCEQREEHRQIYLKQHKKKPNRNKYRQRREAVVYNNSTGVGYAIHAQGGNPPPYFMVVGDSYV